VSSPHEHERVLDLFGTTVRLLVGPPGLTGAPQPELACTGAEAVLRAHQRALTRFDGASELSQLNADPAEARRVSDLTARAIAGALWAAERSGGLVDPTLLGSLEQAGYASSRVGAKPASLREALLAAPARQPATPRPDAAWSEIEVTGRDARRPAGVRLDLGGTAKGWRPTERRRC
jgi:FAD:protein FMN transferase